MIAIHGFGRIGRSVLRASMRDGLWAPSVITDIKDPKTLAMLLEFDTNYGRWSTPVTAGDDWIALGDRKARYVNVSEGIPDWAALNIDVVIDCTGRAVVRDGAEAHLERGASRVLVSAPSKTAVDSDLVLLRGINDDAFDASEHQIVSMASCTTNALAPVVKVLYDVTGIRTGLFSTVHAYTNTQSLTDQPMRELRDSWAAAENIIPSPSGAAKALAYVWPSLKITGKAYRVPVRTVSIVELNAIVERPTDASALADAFREAAATGPLRGVIGVEEGEFASARFLGEPQSSVIDLPLLQVSDDLVSVAAWYDNEMGYATRLAEVAARLSMV